VRLIAQFRCYRLEILLAARDKQQICASFSEQTEDPHP
jgi:hypothetical protein